jgi:hypothetical protein
MPSTDHPKMYAQLIVLLVADWNCHLPNRKQVRTTITASTWRPILFHVKYLRTGTGE